MARRFFIMRALVVCLILTGVMVYFIARQVQRNAPGQIACTLEAKLCPDGSAVGRTGPNCEFALCPGEEARD